MDKHLLEWSRQYKCNYANFKTNDIMKIIGPKFII